MRWSGPRVGPVVLLALLLAVSPIPVSPADVPTGRYHADTLIVPIPANATLGLDDPASEHWRAPLGWSGTERMERIIVYSAEGHAVVYEVGGRALPDGGRGMVATSNTTHGIPENVTELIPVKFRGDLLFALAGDTLYELDANTMAIKREIRPDLDVIWWSNLWNRWSNLNPVGTLLYAFCNETAIGLYAKVPPFTSLGESRERMFLDTLHLDDYDETRGSRIVGAPVLLNVLHEENGSLVVVATDRGVSAFELIYDVDQLGYVNNIALGPPVWYVSYEDIGDLRDREVVPVRDHPISIGLDDPREWRGKDRILLLSEEGSVHSILRENGTLGWSLDLTGDDHDDFEMTDIWPNWRGDVLVAGNVVGDGLLVALDPDLGCVMGNGTRYQVLPGALSMRPGFSQSSRTYVLNTEEGTVCLLSENLDRQALLEAPGAMATDVAYLGNVVNNVGSTQGNYYGAVLEDGTLWAQAMGGAYVPPPLPSVDGDAPRAVIVTDLGNITVGLLTDYAPRTSALFVDLVTSGVYDGTVVASVVRETSFTSGGVTDTRVDIPNEGMALALPHESGAVSMVPHGPGTTGPEFLIVTSVWGAQELDGEFPVFGRVLDGMEVAAAIGLVQVDEHLRPLEDVLIREVVMLEPPDTILPEARVEDVADVRAGDTVVLNGSASTDNVGVVNWTWSLDGGRTTLYGPVVELALESSGNHTVDLTVRDAAGNSATETVAFTVLPVDTSHGDGVGSLGYALLVAVVVVVVVAVGLWTRKRG